MNASAQFEDSGSQSTILRRATEIEDPQTGARKVRRVPLEGATTVAQTKAKMEDFGVGRGKGDLPVLSRAPKFEDYADKYPGLLRAGERCKASIDPRNRRLGREAGGIQPGHWQHGGEMAAAGGWAMRIVGGLVLTNVSARDADVRDRASGDLGNRRGIAATSNDRDGGAADVAGTAAGHGCTDDKPVNQLRRGERLGRHRIER